MYTDYTVDLLLRQYRSIIGTDYPGYRNHVYRVFLNCLLMDRTAANREKYAIAAVFHDIAIWSHHTIDYLDPSIRDVEQYLKQAGKEEMITEISAMIYWHHKVSSYKGAYVATVETFRKADWIDVSFGVIAFGTNRKLISNNRKVLPNNGFHWMLLKKLVRNFFRHPGNPLPMFRK